MVRPPRLDGSKAKRDRAEHHLKTVETLINDFLASNPYPITIKAHPTRGNYFVKLLDPKPLPAQQIALLVGDCVHNMRSALDYIIWELAGADPSDRESMFPIYDDAVKFKASGARRIKKLAPGPHALVERMQPYQAGNRARAAALWAIEHLDVADKHKLLTVTVPVARQLLVSFSRSVRARVIIPEPDASLEHNAVIGIVNVSPPAPDVDVNVEFTPDVTFGDDGDVGLGKSVIPNLRQLLTQVDLVTARFAPFF